MIRKKKAKPGKHIVDISGPDGNAYCLIGRARGLAEQLGLDHKKITEEMKSGDYENLIKVFDKYFGQYVILER
jgi:hypothetical protein